MSDTVSWVLQLNVKDADAFKSLASELVASTNEEAGALIYEYMFTDDSNTCHIYERYVDSAAVMVHLGNFGSKFAERFMSLVDITGLYVYGNPSADARGVLDTLGATYMAQFDGFAR